MLQVRRVVRQLPVAPAADVIDGAVHGDPRQPGAHVRPRFEAGELAVRLQPGFLHDVLGVLDVADEAVGHREEVAAVALDEHPEGLGVAAPRPGDDQQVALVHA